MAMPLAPPSTRPLYVLLLVWAAVIAVSWLLPAVLGLDPAIGWLVFLALQAAATALAVAVAVAALRRRVDLSRAVFAASFLPLLWGLGVALWLGGLLYLAS
jgi:hypothetical protein